MEPMNLSLGLEGTHVLITGAAGHIGRVTVNAFLSAGCNVTALDVSEKGLNDLSIALGDPDKLCTVIADVSNQDSMRRAWAHASHEYGAIVCVVAMAGLDLSVLDKSGVEFKSLENWNKVMSVNVDGTFLTAKQWLSRTSDYADLLRNSHEDVGSNMRNCSFIIVGSESGHWGECLCAEYATSKSAIMGGLLQSLKAEVPKVLSNARVNAIAPGPVDTARFRKECAEDEDQLYVDAQATTAMGKPVPPEAVAKAILFLASESWSGHVHGQILNVDSGKLGKLMWAKGEKDGW